jgi:hypothetical protein
MHVPHCFTRAALLLQQLRVRLLHLLEVAQRHSLVVELALQHLELLLDVADLAREVVQEGDLQALGMLLVLVELVEARCNLLLRENV